MKRKDSSSFITAINKIGDESNISFSKKQLTKVSGKHWHDFYEIEIILSGEGTHILNGYEHPFKRGLVYILSPLDFHQLKPKGKIELYNIMFRESMLTQDFILTLLRTNNILYFDEKEFENISLICNILESEINKSEKYNDIFLKNMLESFLILILRKMENSTIDKSKTKDAAINNAVIYIHQHFKENPSLTQTANLVHLSPKYFSQKFKETTGRNFNQYLTELKLSHAKKLLISSDLSVAEICFASGFTSLSNFMKTFKKNVGFAPLQYIKSIGSSN